MKKKLPPKLEAWGRDILKYGKEMGWIEQDVSFEEFLEHGTLLIRGRQFLKDESGNTPVVVSRTARN